ncbi:MAG: acyl-ACP desaturase [Candidatus Omnitrophica bacterium]|nr:acyl-ACP desaturase [Candidatus Omnitrophota bacterium]
MNVLKSMEGFVEEQLVLLNPVQESWQPGDLLPDLTVDDWRESLQRLREGAQGIPDDALVVLVGNTVTEEALPSYQTMANRHPGVADETGASDSPWARWTRGWTAEENRHGELLSTYLYLSGRVDMREVQVTTQYLIGNGFDPHTANDPYKGLVYTSFQERATRVSHGNMAQLANKSGDVLLGKMCNLVAGDEARHEEVYKRFVKKILELDPGEGVQAIAQMMTSRVVMPARLMSDGSARDLFSQFALVAQRVGVYTTHDYAAIMEHLVAYWDIAHLSGLRDAAAKAQDYLCGLAARYRAVADSMSKRLARQPKAAFRWIFNRSV